MHRRRVFSASRRMGMRDKRNPRAYELGRYFITQIDADYSKQHTVKRNNDREGCL